MVGIRYGLDLNPKSPFRTRVQHVLAHAYPNASNAQHWVFSVAPKEVLKVVDEAWVNRGAARSAANGVYDIPMGRQVGTAGETHIRIVVRPRTSEITTAFPVK